MGKRQEFSFLAYCAASGLCGALSAICGKEAGHPAASPYIAVAMYFAMLTFNFVGLTLFSLALRRTASLQATAASVSANILASGMLGWAIYSETLYARWWLGVACLTIGTALVQTRTDAKITEQGIEEEEDYYQRTRQQPKEVIRKYKLPYKYIAEVAYDGTRYNGFQLQKSSLVEEPSSTLIITTSSNLKNNKRATHPPPTIQGKLETALTRFLGINRDDLLLQGAGRTDAGVHARGQVVHFFSKRRVEDTNRAVRALNSLLPEDIHVLRLLRVPLDYNVRFSMGKIYTYDLHLDPLGSDPFTQRYRLCPKALLNSKTFEKNTFNLEALSSAAAVFVGTHDFSVFSSKPRDKSQRSVERTIRRCEITSAPSLNMAFSDPLLRIEIEGDGFLYKQVRHMVGAMLAAASGRITSENISKALADPVNRGGMEGGALARSGAYILAEPHGLCLKKVFLPDPPGNPEELMYGEQGPILKRRNELLEFFDK